MSDGYGETSTTPLTTLRNQSLDYGALIDRKDMTGSDNKHIQAQSLLAPGDVQMRGRPVRWDRRSQAESNRIPTSQITQYADGVRHGLNGLQGYWSKLSYLLIFVPCGILAGLFRAGDVTVFTLNFIGCVPLAAVLGKATEDLAAHTNESVGGLLNATFGNAVEIILAIAALRAGMHDVIRWTLVGSILSNLLMVLGSAFFFGGMIFREQAVHQMVAEANADLLVASSFGFVMPTVFEMSLPDGKNHERLAEIFSLSTAVGMLLIYSMFLYFQLFTHYETFESINEELDDQPTTPSTRREEEVTTSIGQGVEDEVDGEEEQVASFRAAMTILVLDVILVSICSEFIVGSIEGFSEAAGLGKLFVSTILLPVVGNAVEHFSAVMVAMKNKMDLSIGIACGSSVQIAVFAAPLMVVLSWLLGDTRLTLNMGIFNTVCVVMSVNLVNTTLRDTRTNWLEGAILLTSYAIIGAALFLFDKA